MTRKFSIPELAGLLLAHFRGAQRCNNPPVGYGYTLGVMAWDGKNESPGVWAAMRRDEVERDLCDVVVGWWGLPDLPDAEFPDDEGVLSWREYTANVRNWKALKATVRRVLRGLRDETLDPDEIGLR